MEIREMNAFFKGSALLLALGLAGCATRGGGTGETAGGMEVTRTHLGQPIARGQIAVEAFQPADANDPAFGSYAAAVGQQLTRLGWTVLPTRGQTEQVALVDVVKGSTTTLEVRIKRRSEGSVFWQGRATGPGDIQRLAEAVFRDFPGESGRTIRLR
jgi:hypothetical protein